ncbi:MAG: hypothetical protein GC191_17885 [Azospirillum sp.]|nr:hypothetical protein [Azospirillum sp.]
MGLLGTMATIAGGLRAGLFDPPAQSGNGETLASAPSPPPPTPAPPTPAPPAAASPAVASSPVASIVLAGLARPLDDALGAQIDEAAGRRGDAGATAEGLNRVVALFAPDGGSPVLPGLARDLAGAWRALAAAPEQSDGDRLVARCASAFVAEVRRLASGVEDLAQELGSDLTAGVAELNRTVGEVHRINRRVVTLRALGQSTEELESTRGALAAKARDLLGVRVFSRDSGELALFAGDGRVLVDRQPVTLILDGTTLRRGDDRAAVPIGDGRLSALRRMLSDGSRLPVPQRPGRAPNAEIVRKLRGQLDGLAQAVAAPAPKGRPASFADIQASAAGSAGELTGSPFIGGNRLSLALQPDFAAGLLRPKRSALSAGAAILSDTKRALAADGLPEPGAGPAGLATAICAGWVAAAAQAAGEARITVATSGMMETRYRHVPDASPNGELTRHEALQSALAATAHLSRVAGQLAETLGPGEA